MVKHLPPAIKQLLAQRNPHAFASPPVHRLNSVLQRTRTEAQKYGVEDGWLVLSTCTLLTANTPATMGDLYRFATRTETNTPQTSIARDARIDVAAKMREAALKSSIFVGVPRTILALASMTEAFEDNVKNGLRNESHRQVLFLLIATPSNIEDVVSRGHALWKSIYEPHAEKLYNKLGSYHPDFIILPLSANWPKTSSLMCRNVSGYGRPGPRLLFYPLPLGETPFSDLVVPCPSRPSVVLTSSILRPPTWFASIIHGPHANPKSRLRIATPCCWARLYASLPPPPPSPSSLSCNASSLDKAFIIQAYGVVLAPHGYPVVPSGEQGDISRALGSVVGVACLRAESRVGPQLTSHVFGLLKARNEPVLSSEDRWLSSDEGTEWVIRSVDQIYDVARGGEPEPEAKL
ncbi:hypothetical protein EW145_g2278 [Phellinidium pouzarii]|uniref:Uncharacterized protein n=1 Tax=Phellinidium pouzarii TaxID=167371 RepID=A0A4S4LBW3_9AGAM|nr:hypothetical protein EW145_g2278 [Phellinidium pouzarii]